MRKNNQFYIRKTHRYLGVIIGAQFLMWTLGGLYFSWSNIDVIHGDPYIHQDHSISHKNSWESPTQVIQKIKNLHDDLVINKIQVVSILKDPIYQILYTSENKKYIQLAYAETGELRLPLTREEAEKIAVNSFIPKKDITSVELINTENINAHHEYRGSPLPAYAITFDHPTRSVLYISKEMGTLQKIRIDKWRAFDFLWMLHIMDYRGRDDFGNVLLKTFSILGLVTIFSGFTLFIMSSPLLKKRKNRT
jgi:hypothetical protein